MTARYGLRAIGLGYLGALALAPLALIAYQQQRRNWMDSLDQVAFQVRFQLRNLRVSAYNYHRVQKRQMELAYLVVDQSLQAFNQPQVPSINPVPTAVGFPGSSLSSREGALVGSASRIASSRESRAETPR